MVRGEPQPLGPGLGIVAQGVDHLINGFLDGRAVGGGVAILTQATTAVSAYLAAERERGRIAADADIDSLTLSLVGGGHLLFADRSAEPPTTERIGRFVTVALAEATRQSPYLPVSAARRDNVIRTEP